MSEHSSCLQSLTLLSSKEEVPSEPESCSVQAPSCPLGISSHPNYWAAHPHRDKSICSIPLCINFTGQDHKFCLNEN